MNLDNSYMISMLKSGEEKYFDEFYKYFFPRLCSFASQYVTPSEAEGITQETMLWLWENSSTLLDAMSLKSLLFTIVKNKSLNLVTQKQTKDRIHENIVARFQAQFEDPDLYLENNLLSIFEEAVNTLPEAYKEAFLMSRIEELSHVEIAAKLKVSHQTVNYRIGQALKILRKELKDYLPLLLFLI